MGSGRIEVLIYLIGYFRVPYLLSGNVGYFGYTRQMGLPELSGIPDDCVYPKCLVFPDILGYPIPDDFQN